MNYICPTCRKTREHLVEEGKLNLVQGYEQCADCFADLEYESVVLREDLWKEARKKAEENDDYTVLPPNPNAAKVLGIEPRETKILNSIKYLPEWYRQELQEKQEETNKLFSDLHESYKDYNEIID